MMKTISYFGLGTMGSGMASNLLKAGYELTVWNRSAEKCEPFARNGARVADTPRDAVRNVDLVMYCLSNDQAVEEVVTVYDFYATVLHLLGLDHEKLTYYHNGIQRRLTDVHGRVIRKILA